MSPGRPSPSDDSLAPRARTFEQARARATYEALLDSARDVFSRHGFDDAQTPDIARAAKVSVGTFYRYFRDKRQIFVEMIASHLAAVHEQVAEQITLEKFHGDRRRVIEQALDLLCAHVRQHPALHRVYLSMSLRDHEVAALRRSFERKGEALIAHLIEAIAPPGAILDARAAAHVIVVATLEITFSRAGLRMPSGSESTIAVRDDLLRWALGEMIHRFVFPA